MSGVSLLWRILLSTSIVLTALFGLTGWAVQSYAGRVSEHVIAGQAFIRVDVPETPQEAAFTKLLGPGSIYAISPCSEELARAAAGRLHSEPIPVYIPKQLPSGPTRVEDAELEDPLDDDDDDRPR